MRGGNGDNNILAVALEQRQQEVMGRQPPVVPVTKDTNLSIKAKGMEPLEVEAISSIRGRSIHRQYMVVNEAHSLKPHEVTTIVPRVGQGTKIVLTGDTYPIDHPYLCRCRKSRPHLVGGALQGPVPGWPWDPQSRRALGIGRTGHQPVLSGSAPRRLLSWLPAVCMALRSS